MISFTYKAVNVVMSYLVDVKVKYHISIAKESSKDSKR